MRLLLDKRRQAEFVELVNSAFDILNSRSAEGHKNYDYALGYESEFKTKMLCIQEEILQRAKEEIGGMRVINNRVLQERGVLQPVGHLLPFQKGWMVSIDAALELRHKLATQYGAKFLMTSRINQDVVENLFSRIRYLGACNDYHPGPAEFKRRLKALLLARSADFVVNSAPVKTVVDCDKDEDVTLTQQLVQGVCGTECATDVIEEIDLGRQEAVVTVQQQAEIDCTSEATKYLAGYVAFKFKKSHPELGEGGTLDPPVSCPWIDAYSYGGLMRPSASWLEQFVRLEGEFHNFHGGDIRRESQIIHKLERELARTMPEVPADVRNFYSKMRTHIRIRYLRMQHKTSSEEERNRKKMKQFTT